MFIVYFPGLLKLCMLGFMFLGQLIDILLIALQVTNKLPRNIRPTKNFAGNFFDAENLASKLFVAEKFVSEISSLKYW